MRICFRRSFFQRQHFVFPAVSFVRPLEDTWAGGVRTMTFHSSPRSVAATSSSAARWNEKESALRLHSQAVNVNPVIESAEYVYKSTGLVKIDPEGVRRAARHIYTNLVDEGYSPLTWRKHPLHLLPPENHSPTDPRTKACLDWIFLVSSLNFCFWSSKEGTGKQTERFCIEWREGWGSEKRETWTGYWSLVAGINKALENNIPITDPQFYASSTLCPDAVIEDIFRPASRCTESVPLLAERISVMREVGAILNSKFGGSYAGLLSHFVAKHSGQGTALQFVKMVVEEFPSFRDEVVLDGKKVCFWKRAQILVAETWAAFYPSPTSDNIHPFFPRGISQLTMFADYRVPQILHHLQIISYPRSLLAHLKSGVPLPFGSPSEISIRAASILAVESLRDEIMRLRKQKRIEESCTKTNGSKYHDKFPSVVIDFYLWDLAKKVERGEEKIDGIQTNEMVPAHRTRSKWY